MGVPKETLPHTPMPLQVTLRNEKVSSLKPYTYNPHILRGTGQEDW